MTTAKRSNIQAASFGAGAGLAMFAALSFVHQPTSNVDITKSSFIRTEGAPVRHIPDGAIHAGISPVTGKPMYTTPKDAPLTYTFDQAQAYCAALDTGNKDWRVPTKAELNVLFQNRDAIGGFDTTGSIPAGWYWSSSRYTFTAWAQRFSDGFQDYGSKTYASSLRCVLG
jgi:hypothetical protein